MNSRRGIFFNSKSRTNDKITSLSSEIPTSDPSSSVNQTGTVKKKIILNHSKRAISKTIYSGPRRIFSTNYKANRTQLNHKAFFGGNTDEYDLDSDPPVKPDNLHVPPTVQTSKGKPEAKQIITTVSAFRQPTTCAELDETQSYIDDVEYLLVGFHPEKLLGDRCLSAIKFAELCTKPSFRVHLQNENSLERVFNLLKDAPDLPSLNLCTSFILYILSSDTLASQMNRQIINLMLDLVKKNSSINIYEREYRKIKEKILLVNNNSLPEEIFFERKFNTQDLILEAFVNVSHDNLNDSLRDKIRTSLCYDMMIDTVNTIVKELSNNNVQHPPPEDFTPRYRKVCRYINMLEEFANENQELSSATRSDVNRMYISQYNQYSLFNCLSKLLDLSLAWLKKELSFNENNQTTTTDTKSLNIPDIFRNGCKTIISILVICTNDCEANSDRLTSDDKFFSNLFRLLVTIEKSSFTNEDKFDTLALTLNLLINLVQNTKHIYKRLMDENMPDGNSLKMYEYLAKLFCEQESLAARAESHEENDWMMEDVDDDFDEQLDTQASSDNGATFNRALQKATGHMENTFVAAFSGVVLAVILLRDRTAYVTKIQELMPQKKFDTMAFILKKFFVFMHMSHAFTPSGVKILEELISMVLSLCG